MSPFLPPKLTRLLRNRACRWGKVSAITALNGLNTNDRQQPFDTLSISDTCLPNTHHASTVYFKYSDVFAHVLQVLQRGCHESNSLAAVISTAFPTFLQHWRVQGSAGWCSVLCVLFCVIEILLVSIVLTSSVSH